jgi:hypothetical protein
MVAVASVLAVGGVLVSGILAPGERRMEVKLVFVGYTNTSMPVRYAAPQSGTGTIEVSVALLRATNINSVPVKLWASIRQANFGNTTDFGWPTGRGLPVVVKPRESVAVTFHYPPGQPRWRTELFYQRHGLSERLYGRLWDAADPAGQRWISRILGAPADGTAESGWITNVPPIAPLHGQSSVSIPSGRFHITAPPLPETLDFAPLQLPARAQPGLLVTNGSQSVTSHWLQSYRAIIYFPAEFSPDPLRPSWRQPNNRDVINGFGLPGRFHITAPPPPVTYDLPSTPPK